MWIKALLAICIVAFGTGMGYFAAGKWRARKEFYVQMCLFHERYLNELNYERKPLGVFFSAYEYTGDFGKTVRSCAEGHGAAPAYKYFSMLGTGDALSQKNYFSAQTAALTQKRENGVKEAKSRGELYVKLGLLAGLAAVILIV